MSTDIRVEVRQDGELVEWWSAASVAQAAAIVNDKRDQFIGDFFMLSRLEQAASIRTEVCRWLDNKWQLAFVM